MRWESWPQNQQSRKHTHGAGWFGLKKIPTLSGRQMGWTPNPKLQEKALHGWTLSRGAEHSNFHKIPSLMHLYHQYHYTKLSSPPLRKYLASFNNQTMTEPKGMHTVWEPCTLGPPASIHQPSYLAPLWFCSANMYLDNYNSPSQESECSIFRKSHKILPC